jgi:hypothetical protein
VMGTATSAFLLAAIASRLHRRLHPPASEEIKAIQGGLSLGSGV